ncbi:Hypothetical protein PHPALM_11154 [Phytophthora palmivora]|uniref:Uncharacterized protein n=1 Tax=Phytophthora palmivora TaxID=4796 RepID=A0A2P4Y2Y7_9STRA|nr:Hypothetical protein PHPALM_11154 [Phytophthora palmivora]
MSVKVTCNPVTPPVKITRAGLDTSNIALTTTVKSPGELRAHYRNELANRNASVCTSACVDPCADFYACVDPSVDTSSETTESSAILATDGSVPVDYGSDSEEGAAMEDEVPSSSDKKDSQPSAGSRRPREDDPDASSPKRPRSDIEAAPSTSEAPADAFHVGSARCSAH